MGYPLANTLTILVVDDEPVARKVAYRTLSEEGFRVLEADGPEEALEVLSQARGRIDLVMLDVVMRSGDGVALAREIAEEWPDQRILYMSAHPAEVLARYGLRDFDVVFLAKPYSRNELLERVQAALTAPLRAENRERAERREDSRPG